MSEQMPVISRAEKARWRLEEMSDLGNGPPCAVEYIVCTFCSPGNFAGSFKKNAKRIFRGVVSAKAPWIGAIGVR
jgi:hypothetical protein